MNIYIVKFPSEEWAEEYVKKLNSNAGYNEAGESGGRLITFVIESDENCKGNWFLYFDLKTGKCVSSKTGTDESSVPASTFKYKGKYSNWVKLIKGEIDPIQGLMTGKFKLEGSMIKIMRYTKAAKEMVNTATLADTQFEV
ncbi:MAG: SCP2 sterol-binding domain-containing protein [Ferroplasma sp.]